MKRLMIMSVVLTMLFALSSNSFAQNKTKARSNSTSKAKSTKTKPVSGTTKGQGKLGNFEIQDKTPTKPASGKTQANEALLQFEIQVKAPERDPSAPTKAEASVFEPNDANTWIKDNPKENAGTPKDGKIMDIVDMAKQPESQNSSQNNSSTVDGKPKQSAVTPAQSAKKPVVFEDVIVSSKTSKPKRKPTKAAASKRKPN